VIGRAPPEVRSGQEPASPATALCVLQLGDSDLRCVQRLLQQQGPLDEEVSGIGLLRDRSRDRRLRLGVLIDAANLDQLPEEVLQKRAFLRIHRLHVVSQVFSTV